MTIGTGITTSTVTRRVILGKHVETGVRCVLTDVTHLDPQDQATMLNGFRSGQDRAWPYSDDLHIAVETVKTTYMRVRT